MEKLLTLKNKNTKHNKTISKNCNKLTIGEIEKFYNCDENKKMRYGLEYERISLDKKTLKNASYDKVSKIIEHFSKISNWEVVYDNKTIIGAKSDCGSSISLEPGCQLEISLSPKENIIDIDIELSKIINLLDNIAQIYDVIFVGYGISPNTSVDEIEILNKERYQIMNNYLPNCYKGELAQKMMRQTAGIQINIDYKDKKDAYLKLKFFNLIMPFVTGLCANSPLENNCLSAYKTLRSNVWRYTGANRCNLFYKDIFYKRFFKYSNVLKNYINEIIDVPMIYIIRNNENIPLNGKITFREFMKKGFSGYLAAMEDYILHQSLCFPDIRLKNYIEIRNHDSSTPQIALSLCAFYKGLAQNDTEDLLNSFEYLKFDKIDDYYRKSATYGLDFTIKPEICAWSVVQSLLNYSLNGLNSKDRMYLKPLAQMIKHKKTQADIIIDYDIKNTNDLINFLCE